MGKTPLKTQLEAAFGLSIVHISSVAGGDIAASYVLTTQSGRFFAKCLDAAAGRDMLEAEAEGLRAIESTGCLRVPKIVGCAGLDSGACLLMEYISVSQGKEESYAALGRGLAKMHRVSSSSFGWTRPNYIGSLPQQNTPNPELGSILCPMPAIATI